MSEHPFKKDDVQQMNAHDISLKEVKRQLALFKTARPYLKLTGPCVPGKGIRVFDRETQETLSVLHEKEKQNRSFIKFVPASGAASRMFKVLSAYSNRPGDIKRERVSRDASAGEASAKQLLVFMEGIARFAFFQDLSSVISRNGLSAEALLAEGAFRDIIRLLLKEEGLGYAICPKGLSCFTSIPKEMRTAFEEHLVEAVSYAGDAANRCTLHFTVSPEHLARFEACFKKFGPTYEEGARGDL
jgi:hypothetical protein